MISTLTLKKHITKEEAHQNALIAYIYSQITNEDNPQINLEDQQFVISTYIEIILTKAAQNMVQAEFLLGKAYQNGYGVSKLMCMARYWYEKAYSHGQVHSILRLLETQKSEENKENLVCQGVRRGSKKCLLQLAWILLKKQNQITKYNIEIILKLKLLEQSYRKIYLKNSSSSTKQEEGKIQYCMGFCNQLLERYEKAKEWYKKSKQKNCLKSSLSLAKMYKKQHNEEMYRQILYQSILLPNNEENDLAEVYQLLGRACENKSEGQESPKKYYYQSASLGNKQSKYSIYSKYSKYSQCYCNWKVCPGTISAPKIGLRRKRPIDQLKNPQIRDARSI